MPSHASLAVLEVVWLDGSQCQGSRTMMCGLTSQTALPIDSMVMDMMCSSANSASPLQALSHLMFTTANV